MNNTGPKKGSPSWAQTRPTPWEIGLGVGLGMLWATFFFIGLSVPGNDFRENAVEGFTHVARATTQPNTSLPWIELFRSILGIGMTGIAYTITNVLFLTIAASSLGCMAYRWSTPFDATTASVEATKEVRRAYMSSGLRSILLYFLAIAGYFVIMPENALTITAAQYVRMAGALSATAFVVGYKPQSLAKLMQMIFVDRDGGGSEPLDGGGSAATLKVVHREVKNSIESVEVTGSGSDETPLSNSRLQPVPEAPSSVSGTPSREQIESRH